jgi:excisionase family DNA binding protein
MRCSVKGDDFLLVREVAVRLRVAPNTVRAWAANGKLREYRHPVNNYRLFKRDDVEALLRKIEDPPPFDELPKPVKPR